MFDFHGTKETCCCRPDCAAQLDQGGFKRFAFQQQTEGLHLYPSPAVSKGKKNIKKHAESQLLIHLVQFYGGHISGELLCADYSLIISLKSNWIFHLSDAIVCGWFSQSRNAAHKYSNTGKFKSTLTLYVHKVDSFTEVNIFPWIKKNTFVA